MQQSVEYDYQVPEVRVERERLPETVKKCGHAVVIAMLVFLMTVIFLVVWQEGVTRSLETKKQQLQSEIADLEMQHRVYRAAIATERMPESLVRHAMDGDMQFMQIPSSSLILVAKGQ